MRWVRALLIVLGLAGLFAGCVVLSTFGWIGDGIYWQEVIIESSKPVAQAWYANDRVKESTRYLMEHDPNPKYFGADEPVKMTGNRFAAKLWFSEGPAPWNGPRYTDDLIVVVEFADGTRAAKAVKVPKKPGNEPVVVRFP